jgi:hypothetical protein
VDPLIVKRKGSKSPFPVKCEYYGGLEALGTHGRHFWIENGRLGHGNLRLTHGIPLADVLSVEVSEREGGGSEGDTFTLTALRGASLGISPTDPFVITDIKVHTKTGTSGLWFVEKKDASWVRSKLNAALQEASIPYYNEQLS